MPDRSRSRPRDVNQLAHLIGNIATGQAEEEPVAVNQVDHSKDPAAVALGRTGGLKGGKARAEKMTPQERSEAARKAVQARWAKKNDPKS
jgi:hypothetical protein